MSDSAPRDRGHRVTEWAASCRHDLDDHSLTGTLCDVCGTDVLAQVRQQLAESERALRQMTCERDIRDLSWRMFIEATRTRARFWG